MSNKEKNNIDISINKSNSAPLYIQVEKKLRSLIKSGEIKKLKTPLTEKYLEDQFDVSRNTIRRAISKLVEDGLIISRRAKGIRLLNDASRILSENASGLSITEVAIKKGQTPSAKLLTAKEIYPSKKVSKALGIVETEKVFYCRRLRLINKRPVCIVDFYLPMKLVPGISADDFSETGPNQSMHYVLEKLYDIKIARSLETIEARSISKEDAKLLKIPEGNAVVFKTDIVFSTLTEIIGYDEITHTDDYKITGRIIKERL